MTTPTTTIPQFDLAEIEVMMEALPKWAEAGAEGEFLGSLMGAMFSKDLDEDAKAKMKAEDEARRAKRDQEVRRRKERAILIQAKLIGIADHLRAAQMVEGALR